MPMNGSRTQPMRGSMTPPLPSPPMTAPTARIFSTTLASPTAERWQGTPKLRAMSSMTREVDMLMTTGPFSCRSRQSDGQRQRQLFADVAARFVDDGQAVGVGVEHKADVGLRSGEPAVRSVCRFSASGSGGC